MKINIIKARSRVGISINNDEVTLTIKTKNRNMECKIKGYENVARFLSQEHGIDSEIKDIIKE